MKTDSTSHFRDPAAVRTAVDARFRGARALVVGDVMLDRYLWGDASRISPEAPIPVVRIARESDRVGGAANVAWNLGSLGLDVTLVGVVGQDPEGDAFLRAISGSSVRADGVCRSAARPTTTKTRVIAAKQQVVRLDRETSEPIDAELSARVLASALAALPSASVVVLSDYSKGVLSPAACREIVGAARAAGVPVLVDPKGRDFTRYAGATTVTPNRGELAAATGARVDDLGDLLAAANRLRRELALAYFVVTLGDGGIACVGAEGVEHLPAVAREVADVSGAGDTVIATLAAGVAAGLERADALRLANLAAGVVVGKVGTAPIDTESLLAELDAAGASSTRWLSWEQASERVARWKAAGMRVVFTNGCFDILHAGHTDLLEQARRQGDRLVVGLNSDASVRRLKGPTRPIVTESDRARVLASLASVDAVVLFDQDTPTELVRRLLPDVLVKGADYEGKPIAGADDVIAAGGRVHLVPLVAGRSTTSLVEKTRRD